MYTLYGREQSGSLAVEAALEIAGAPYRVAEVERRRDGDYPPEFLAISPLGQVPALVLPGGEVMTESAAILLHLAEHHPALAPSADQRPRFLRWMLFCAANVYMTDLRVYYSERYTADPAGVAAVKAEATVRMAREWNIFAGALGDGPFMTGAMTALDLYAAMLASWDPDVPALFARHPNVERLYAAVTAHAPVAKVWRRHRM